MRELILLRHAHAEPATPGRADRVRPLAPGGRAGAEGAGKWMEENNRLPDCGRCAPARGARETLEAVLATIGYVEKRLEDRIYEATPGTLAALVDERRDLDRVLIVGHNPGLERLVALMTEGTSSDYRGMPPAAVAVLGFPREAAIEPGVASLNALWWP